MCNRDASTTTTTNDNSHTTSNSRIGQSNKSREDQFQSAQRIPLVASIWLLIYDSLPNITVPMTIYTCHKNTNDNNNNHYHLNISVTLASALFLTCVRYLAEYVLLVLILGWPRHDLLTAEAAGCLGAICHSTILCTGLIIAFVSMRPWDPAAKMSDYPSWFQRYTDSLLQFCTGYMLYDAVVNILWLRFDSQSVTMSLNDDDILFLIHHMMTTMYMTSSRIINAGQFSAMMCMLMGELTNPLHNLYMLGEVASKLAVEDCCYGPSIQRLHDLVSVAFAAMYCLFRAILAPPIFACVSYCLMFTKNGRQNIPLLLNVVWNLMIWAVIVGSSSWVAKCIGILQEFVTEQWKVGNVTHTEL